MDIKDLNKKQMILLTLLITFVVSIATGIVTVSLMNQAPKAVPQTINNVIQRTIEKVTTVKEETKTSSQNTEGNNDKKDQDQVSLVEENILIKIYKGEEVKEENLLGEGVLISDSGIIMIDSNVLNGDEKYTAILGDTNFDATVIKKFSNDFSILKISEKVKKTESEVITKNTDNTTETSIDKTKQ